jgi:hypothetical protein
MWRRVTAGALICALVLQGMALVLAVTRFAGAETNVAGFKSEICHHDGDTSNSQNQTPDPADNGCCIICLAGTSYVLAAFNLASNFHPIMFVAVRWPAATPPLPSRTVDANTRPRGPPPIA